MSKYRFLNNIKLHYVKTDFLIDYKIRSLNDELDKKYRADIPEKSEPVSCTPVYWVES